MYNEKLCSFYAILLILSTKSAEIRACSCYKEEAVSLSNQSYLHCVCSDGHQDIPVASHDYTLFLTLRRHNLHALTAFHFESIDENLIDLQLLEFWKLKYIEKNTFNRFVRLRSLSISKAPALTELSLDVLVGNSYNLRRIEITKTGLEHIPQLRSNNLFDTINLEGNYIRRIKGNAIQVEAEEISLEYNKIETVEAWAFNNSYISRLSLKGNRNLRTVSEETFHGLHGLTTLDLSETSISRMPSTGLNHLRVLRITGTKTLKTIPSIYDFANLTEAELTFSFHCCAFSLPERHDSEKYALFEILSKSMHHVCMKHHHKPNESYHLKVEDEEWHDTPVTPKSNDFISLSEINEKNLRLPKTDGTSNIKNLAFCGSYRYNRETVNCSPQPNAFNPCEDIMGYKWLRVSIWMVIFIGFMGNSCVLAVTLCKLREMTARSFFIINLAFADLCMATFLLLLAVQDFISKDYYFNYAYDWQRGAGCKISGFLTVFSSQLSIFILCFLTIERWFTIRKALYLNELSFRKTIYVIGCGWLYALIMAALPLFGVSSYSTASLCLPMDVATAVSKAYVLFLLAVAMLAFVIICVCYFQIYFSLSHETRHRDGEYALARKMAILVLTNFVCWAPITFFALTALFNYPLIDITNSKILLVFFYPLNSCANPFLYAILTTNFKRNLIFLLSKFGFCRKSAQKYRLIYYQPKCANGHQIHRPMTSETAF